MKTVIYLDTLLLVNFLIGYLLLRGAGLLTGCAPSFGRNLLGGLAAAFSTLILLAPPLPFWGQLAFQALSALAVTRSAFAWRGARPFLRQAAWYLCLNLLLAGVVIWRCSQGAGGIWQTNNLSVYAAVSPALLAGCVAGVYLCARLFVLFFGRPAARPLYRLEFLLGEEPVRGLRALYDTGFEVSDPYTGAPALLVALPAMGQGLPPGLGQALREYFSTGALPGSGEGVRLIQCSTAAGKGVLPAVTARQLSLAGPGRQGTLPRATVIFCREALADGNFDAIFGGGLLFAL